MIQIAEYFYPTPPTPSWRILKQIGVDHAVSTLNRNFEEPWGYEPLLQLKNLYEQAGFNLAVIEDLPPMEKIRLGLAGRDQEIEWFRALLKNMGALEIPVLCYHFMAVFGWQRTSFADRGRGGALVSSYDHSLMEKETLTEAGVVTEDELWENFRYFLSAVVPAAEEAGVRLALHPDDPPVSPIRGISRIMRSVESFQKVIEMVPSKYNGITFCQGNFTLVTKDLPALIRQFGAQKKIFFVHFRDVRGTPEKFVETFHDEGQTDMLACMQAYHDIGFDGVLRSDHVPTLETDRNDKPGYSELGRLFAVGYIKGLRRAVWGPGA